MLQLIRKCQVLSLLLSFSLIYRFVNMYLLYLPILLVICNPLCSYLVFVYWMVSYIWSYKLLFNPVNRYNRDYLGSLHSGNESARNINYIFVFYTSQTSSFTLTKASILVSPWKSPKGQFFFFFFFFFNIFLGSSRRSVANHHRGKFLQKFSSFAPCAYEVLPHTPRAFVTE